MLKSRSLILFLVITAGVILGGVDLVGSFTARSVSGNVVVNWQTTNETNLKQFVIQRRTINGGYSDLAVVWPRSDRTYQYIDQTAFKTSDQIYIYGLTAVYNDGTSELKGEASVAHSNVSSVKRTWGSIKALFR